ncbi:MAG: EF-hand domain-containing protein [Xanthobacteraceae bacterium]
MLLALGAASSAMDALQSLISSKSTSSQTTGFTQNPPTPFDTANGSTQTESPPPVTGGAGFTQISPETMSALIAAQGQDSSGSTTSASTTSAPTDPASALKDLYSQIDTNGDGQISKTEFENTLGAGGTNIAQADDVFNKLDANGDGSVTLDEMQKALQGAHGKGGHHHHHVADSDGSNGATDASGSSPGAGGSNSDPLLQALAGATSTSVTNSDGSTTTSITNADGSVITMTSPAATTSSSSATASYNFLEQMIQRAAQAVSSGAAPSLSLNV